ncbi:prolyl-tRNA synthetase [Hortaea werneckii]|nr:prolyl-tRNA synthetase [Hortaea werneckii]
MFDITVEDPNQEVKEGEKRNKLHVWQNSWGFTTRSIGVMILIHGDDKGLVIPPRVADVQVVIVPVGINAKTTDADREKLYDEVDSLRRQLEDVNVRVECDFREGYSPGYKFNDWEMKGVPLRLEFGPKDSANGVVTTSRRDQAFSKEKGTIPVPDLATQVPALLEQIQSDMYLRASEEYASHRKVIRSWSEFVPTLNAKNVLIVPHCTNGDCEDEIKKDSSGHQEGAAEVDARAPSMGAKSLCIPDAQPEEIKEGTKCINPKCGKEAKMWVMFGRSY